MDMKLKQQWPMGETECLLALWPSTEVQNKLERASTTKPAFEQIQVKTTTAEFNRSTEQITNKLKKLRLQRPKQGPWAVTGALNLATPMLKAILILASVFLSKLLISHIMFRM